MGLSLAVSIRVSCVYSILESADAGLLWCLGPGVVIFDPRRRVELPGTANLADQGNSFGVLVVLQDAQRLSEVGPRDDVSPYSHAEALA